MDGVLVAAKPPGPTSHDVVALVRRLSATRRVGHGGTLDPFASGVLPVFLGQATRLVEYHAGDAKRYRATVCFGATSTTDDLDGELTPVGGPAPPRAAVAAALAAFTGPIAQRPPAFSAIKVEGRRAYAIARGGAAPDLAQRAVTIHSLDLVDWDDTDPARPIAVLDIRCSAGTYIRALARDLGASLGSGAYLGALVRTASGPFLLEDAHPLERIRAAGAAAGGLERLLLPIDAGLEPFPTIALTVDEISAIRQGQFVRPATAPPWPEGSRVRLIGADRRLVAIATVRGERLAPEKVFAEAAPGGATAHARRQEPLGTGTPASPRTRREPRAGGRMRVVPGLAALTPADGRLFVVVGVFDGLHLGHAYLLEQLREGARRHRARPAVITFDAHPDEILLGGAPPILVDPEERIVRLGQAGVAVTVIQHFDATLRMTPYDRFVAMISERTDLAGFLMTPDAAFGHQRGGTPETLAALGGRQGFAVEVVPPFELDGRQVRSAEIRERIAAGDLAGAAALLGRPFAVVGEVVAGAPGDGSGAERDHRALLRFRLPVALPPPGRYRAAVGPPLRAGAQPPVSPLPLSPPVLVEVAAAGDRLLLPAAALAGDGGPRLRVAFESIDAGL